MWGRRVVGKSWRRKGSNVLASGEVSRLCPRACGHSRLTSLVVGGDWVLWDKRFIICDFH